MPSHVGTLYNTYHWIWNSIDINRLLIGKKKYMECAKTLNTWLRPSLRISYKRSLFSAFVKLDCVLFCFVKISVSCFVKMILGLSIWLFCVLSGDCVSFCQDRLDNLILFWNVIHLCCIPTFDEYSPCFWMNYS